MKSRIPQRLPDWLLCLVGFAFGYIIFAALYLWSEGGELWYSMTIGLVLHAPVAIVYGGLLIFLHRRWSAYVTRAALFLGGVAIGLFPLLGVFPFYFFRLDIAGYVLCIHVAALTAIIGITYLITRWTKRSSAV
jgi:hypothetical protein